MAISRLTQTTLQNGFEKYNQVWDGRSAVGSMEPISAITLSAAQSSVEFNNIPSTYSHLQVRLLVRTNRAAYSDDTKLNLNGDTSTNYSYHELIGYAPNTSVTAGTVTGGSTIYVCRTGANSSPTNIFGAGIIDILDYTNNNKYKTIRSKNGVEMDDRSNSLAGMTQIQSGNWRSTSSVVSIQIAPNSGTTFNQYSSFTLYGIK